MADEKRNGGCHCGAVQFEITAPIEGLMECNCSICSKIGWLMAFVPADAFTLIQGDDALRNYQFGKHSINHEFCTTCGIRAFSWGLGEDGTKSYCVNARCVAKLDLAALPVQKFDGASL